MCTLQPFQLTSSDFRFVWCVFSTGARPEQGLPMASRRATCSCLAAAVFCASSRACFVQFFVFFFASYTTSRIDEICTLSSRLAWLVDVEGAGHPRRHVAVAVAVAARCSDPAADADRVFPLLPRPRLRFWHLLHQRKVHRVVTCDAVICKFSSMRDRR